jgi:hypothetical protein
MVPFHKVVQSQDGDLSQHRKLLSYWIRLLSICKQTWLLWYPNWLSSQNTHWLHMHSLSAYNSQMLNLLYEYL